jgi:DNA-binding response OmpR family regulator
VTARKAGAGKIELAGSGQIKSGPAVLVIDHHSSVLDLCCDVLQENGFVPTAARSGKDARRATAARKFDLYVVDLQLPDFDGRAFIQKLTLGSTTRPAIVAVTGEKNVDKEELRAMGASQVLFKPFSHEEILKVAERLTRTRKSTADAH